MRTRRCEILMKSLFSISTLIFIQCSKKTEEGAHPSIYRNLEDWVEIEVLSQKLTAEQKWNDTLQCLTVEDNLSPQQKDSILNYFSHHPELLKNQIDSLINKK